MTKEELKDRAHGLPLLPGVYIMEDAKSQVIYVGKAKALRNRVTQYFQESAAHSEKTRVMVSNIHHFDVIVTQSEFEALVLENSLIKRHQPRYNILLKDDKGYPYLRLDVKSSYPHFSLSNKMAQDGAKYFGPYGSRGASQAIIDALRTALKLPSCNKKFPRDIGKERPCLNYHLGKCDGYCRTQESLPQHQLAIAQGVRLLEGKFQEVEEELVQQMTGAAEALNFELAAQLRDRHRAITLLGKRQKVMAASLADTHVVGFHRGEAKSGYAILQYTQGELAAKDWGILETPIESQEDEVVSALVRQIYGGKNLLPKQILLPCELEDEASLIRMLSQQVGHRVQLVTPQRGAKVELIALANQNAKEEVARATTKEERENKKLTLLGQLLSLPQPPKRIESYDISNTGKDDIVGAMVVYCDGRPQKSQYRHFKIKDLSGPDDYGAMTQMLQRRFARHQEGDKSFDSLPQVIFMDGGTAHANLARQVLEEYGLNIPVFGMVKDNRHRTRGLLTWEGQEVGLTQYPVLFSFVGQIQEETHRTAITFHQKLRAKRVKGSQLDQISGVGEKRRAALLKHFKSVKKIKEATIEELKQVVDSGTAKKVYQHFHTPS